MATAIVMVAKALVVVAVTIVISLILPSVLSEQNLNVLWYMNRSVCKCFYIFTRARVCVRYPVNINIFSRKDKYDMCVYACVYF